MMDLHGIHHVTAVTRNAKRNLQFYTTVLGLRLVKKTVNQDDVTAYHLFYADKLGTPGTDMTFFDWPQTPPDVRGTDSIVNTLFRVSGRAALDYWAGRLESHGVTHQGIESFDGRLRLRFYDPEGQRLTLVDDGGAPFEGEVWDGAGVPVELGIRGFFGVALSVPSLERYAPIFEQLMGMREARRFVHPEQPDQTIAIYEMDGGGAGKELHVYEQPKLGRARLGHGGVHHVAFRLRDEQEQAYWLDRLSGFGVPNSGEVDRFYFKSLYFRISGGILFELATDGPGFHADEPLESLGERLALPPFLEPRRAQIEAGLKPL
jgi:glyoxalase family protein